MPTHQPTTTPMRGSKAQILSAIFWPSFILAGAANSVFFTFLDPLLIASEVGFEHADTTAMYSIGFFCFWALTLATAVCTQYLLKPLHNSRKSRRGEEQ